MPNATVYLYKDDNNDNIADGAAIATTTTDATGLYQFTALQSGKYIVGVVLPAGYASGATTATSANPNNLTDNDNNGVNTASGEIRSNYITLSASTTTLDIGLSGTGSIGNFVWNDLNGNGVQNGGEAGIAGVTVTITNSGGMILTTTTNAGGNYTFSNLAAGTYTIAFTTPAGYIASPALQGGNTILDSDPVSGNVSVVLTAGQANADIDAGFYQPYTLGNTVWFDVNNNGLKDAGEVGISAATVKLYADANGDNIVDGAALATTTTDATGSYQFANLQSGKYIVGVVIPTGYATGANIATSSNPDNYVDNDNNGINTTAGEVRTNFITLIAATNALDIGLKGGGSIGSRVWLDANGNNIQDAGEAGIAGVTVTLSGLSGLNLTTTTDANGFYSFTSLTPDTYTIHFNTPTVAGAPKTLPLLPRKANIGSDPDKDSDPNPATGNVSVTLTGSDSKLNIDAGFAYDQDYDKDGIPVFNFEICFECSESLVFKNFEVVSENQFEDKCMNYELYKDFFKQCQIHYGIDTP